MENSVTLTLARYHDLIDIEQKFDKQLEKEMEGANEYHSQYKKDLFNKVESLENEVGRLKRLLFACVFWIFILILIIARIKL